MTDTDAACITPTDVTLLDEARDGSAEAFAELFRRHWPPVLSYAISVTRYKATAEDPLTTVRHAVRQHETTAGYRTRSVGAGAELETAMRPATITSAADDLLFDEPQHQRIAAAYRRLPARWQHILQLTVLEERTPAEITVLLDLNAPALRALTYRARRGLRANYETAAQVGEHRLTA